MRRKINGLLFSVFDYKMMEVEFENEAGGSIKNCFIARGPVRSLWWDFTYNTNDVLCFKLKSRPVSEWGESPDNRKRDAENKALIPFSFCLLSAAYSWCWWVQLCFRCKLWKSHYIIIYSKAPVGFSEEYIIESIWRTSRIHFARRTNLDHLA